jgi:hypothetical protein
MWGYIYALIAAFVVSFHIVSMKMMSVHKDRFYEIAGFSLVALVVSRVFIYWAMESVSNPTLVHICLNCSIFMTFLLSFFVLGIKDFNTELFGLGLLLTVVGMGCIQYSYHLKR